jgi:hypothetical protein
MSRPRYTHTCCVCTAEFSSTHKARIFCSMTCRGETMKNRTVVECGHCGEPFEAKNRDFVRGRGKYCSVRCCGLAKDSDFPRGRLMDFICSTGLAGTTTAKIMDHFTPGLAKGTDDYRSAQMFCGTSLNRLVKAGLLSKSKIGRICVYRVRVTNLTEIGQDIKGVKKAGQRIALPGSTPIVEIAKKVAGGFKGPVIVPDNVKFTRIESPSYDVRYSLPPDTRIVGGFATMGIGRYA